MKLTEKQRRRRAKQLGVPLDRITETGGFIMRREGDPITCVGCGCVLTPKPGDPHPNNPPCDWCDAVREMVKRHDPRVWKNGQLDMSGLINPDGSHYFDEWKRAHPTANASRW